MSIIREMRTVAGLTAYELAMRAGISASRLSYLERGIELPSLDEAKALASALAVVIYDAEERLKRIKGCGV